MNTSDNSINLLEHKMSAQGQYPVKSATCKNANSKLAYLEFAFFDGEEETVQRKRENERTTLYSLAFLKDGYSKLDRLRLEELAKKTGPLFGPNRKEVLADWLSASSLAEDVAKIQGCINKDDFKVINEDDDDSARIVSKTIVKNEETCESFGLYTVTFSLVEGTTEDFFSCMPDFPCFKPYRLEDGGMDYAFFNRETKIEEGKENEYIVVNLFSFSHQITSLEFWEAFKACISINLDDEELCRRMENDLGLDMQDALRKSSVLTGSYDFKNDDVRSSDALHVQKIVHAVVSLYFDRIKVDLFRSSGSDDFFVFPNYISYLWYIFAKQLKQVRIAYCVLCRRGYPLEVQRGMPRRFCSPKCKTDAKNARTKEKTDNARKYFLEDGKSVEWIAVKLYLKNSPSGMSADNKKKLKDSCEKVRKSLRTYPYLKRVGKRVCNSNASKEDKELFQRCLKEGIFSEKDFE